MEKVAIYCRLSDEDKNKLNKYDDSESIQNQKNMLTKYAFEKGWSIYNIYSDDDYSGLDQDRPEFNRMIKDAEEGKFSIILCKHQSRFTREMELIEKYLHNKFIEWKIRFISLNDSVDTNEKGGKKARQINGLVNEWYCEDISEAIRSSFRVKVQDGDFIGSFAPYGYEKDPTDKNKLIIDEEAAEVIRRIFQLYLNGNGIQHIAHILNEDGIPNPTKYKQMQGMKFVNSSLKDGYGLWNKTTVRRILQNEVYAGNMVQHKRKKVNYKSKKIESLPKRDWVAIKNTHEPIIDDYTFLAVQKRFKSRARTTGTGETHIFATKLKCLDCGSTMNKVTTNNHVYFRCQLYARSVSEKMCTNHSIRMDQLEEIVLSRLNEHLKVVDEEHVAFRLQQLSDLSHKLDVLKKEFNKIDQEIGEKNLILKNLYIDKVKGTLTEAMFNDFTCQFTKEKEELLNRQHVLDSEIKELQHKIDNIDMYLNQYREMTHEYTNLEKLTHVVVNKCIDRIYIGEKNTETGEQKIKIDWLF